MLQRRPLVNALLEFQKQESISFHVPGHKQGGLSNLPSEMTAALPYDVTELTGLDDLHFPQEAIKEAQLLLAEAYGADQSFFLVNGSTVGNLAMVHATCEEGDQVIVQRNSHKSIFHALELARVRPIYVSPQWDNDSMTAVGVSYESLERAITAYPDAKAVVLTYPNYYGMASTELTNIIQLCHSREMVVLVDEAHGAHFQAGAPFPVSSLALGADAVVQSAHKTLPAMTMGSFLHLQGTRVNRKKIEKYLRMFQSSSPSYLILASLDDARSFIQSYSQPDIRTFERKRTDFINSLRTIPHLTVFESDDPLKLLLRVENYSGFQLKQKMEQTGLYAEMADPYQVLLILPLLKQRHAYPFAEARSRLKEAVRLVREEDRAIPAVQLQESIEISVPELSFEEIDLADYEWIPYTQAIGRIAVGMVIPYPPGIPLVVAGEKWTTAKMEELMNYMSSMAQIQGEHRLEDKKLSVLQQDFS
ncbi:aminotransferase class I/II-fold pyridoxal phosphate-dependent enzyme [Planococcus salinus]|uniref:Aminotransferase class I/II-fold pyridoxal phosphate-dependent enzyme n=1 Tax=Planococcus salinus TaxID=1848460 RepID=A0A3M8P3T2_9BACL|nr:aminotransferase class I/II-fold pyridoxal phosphate-dependent enzyme [Planococcus salinus]RNF38312.1 aminotransferase class I/II-fold pyridoxal phosphate-dependent enzyme [Planococcus salinus]